MKSKMLNKISEMVELPSFGGYSVPKKHISTTKPVKEPLFPQNMDTLITDLSQKQDSFPEHTNIECSIQEALNAGFVLSREQKNKLMQTGYCITRNPKTIVRYRRSFRIPGHAGYTAAIRNANPKSGLLLNKYMAYRPGRAPALAQGGAAQGYDEIFEIVEKQTNEKKDTAAITAGFVKKTAEKRPVYFTEGPFGIIDLGFGNGLQTRLIIEAITGLLPERTSIIINGIDNQHGCERKAMAQFNGLASPQIQARFIHADFFDSLEVLNAQIQSADQEIQPHQTKFIIASHLYFLPKYIPAFVNRILELMQRNAFAIFINGAPGSDGDDIANQNRAFMRGKPASDMSLEIEKELRQQGFISRRIIYQTRINFPILTPEIRQAILAFKMGDYENKYLAIPEDVKIYKALMEFFASFPLESMTCAQRQKYLAEIEACFRKNNGAFLKIKNNLLTAVCPGSDEDFVRDVLD